MILKFFDKLSQNLIELLSDKDDYNVIIIVKNEKSFTAHSSVLKCRSPWFRKELKNIIPNENNIKTITKPDISDEIFDIILNGIVDLENVETKFIFDLMVTVNEFEIEELTKKLENHLIETKSSWLKSHFSLVYRSIFNGNNFKDLEKFCNDIVTKYPSLIFDDEDFTSLQEPALISLLKRDDLQLEEVIIWEYVIKWGIAQNSTLPANPKEWNKENFTTLKTTLQRCLPLIRYFHISGTDVAKKIKPYKKILDKQLWEDLNQYFMAPEQPVESIILPPRTVLAQELPARTTEQIKPARTTEQAKLARTTEQEKPARATDQAKPLSTIISYEHVAEISSWIDHFTSLQEPALISLLKRDDLQLEEVIIWEYVIKWGIAQNSTLPANPKEWNKENFTTLKTTLQRCLPLIRYFHISGTDVAKKIKPYKKILDKQLWEDLNQYFMAPEQPVESIILPPRTVLAQELPARTTEQIKPARTTEQAKLARTTEQEKPARATDQAKPLSTIISYEHVAEISSWIDRKSSTYSLISIPYEFKLILRGSINGFAPQTFWKTCHGHSSTVAIMKVKGTDEILGGYNPLIWNANSGGGWGITNDSFIFSLKNGNIQNSNLSRVKIPDNAIFNAPKSFQMHLGPYFGDDLRMYSPRSNFTLDKKCVCDNISRHYEKPIRAATNDFAIVDYEVFKVIKKSS
ncbi:hypothetical protein Glove_24g71 [Diversispora epigaea]|uniref:BTB domain-containing protein n=1 Tax=Diversispora epigaea TaxID=1348612 RepID=A0A397JQI1_9GLOM|nr:hypothetical protein Glove_24g71 [Diversispora epigaea]